ncbi:MAG: PEP-CTERM sorting domain-containing protein [Sphingobium sp.]
MTVNKMFLAVGAMALLGAATPAQATWGCWFSKKCGGNSSSGGSSSGGTTSSSSGGATPVPEPEQMALFGMGVAVLAARAFRSRRNSK